MRSKLKTEKNTAKILRALRTAGNIALYRWENIVISEVHYEISWKHSHSTVKISLKKSSVAPT